jgi:integrase/recombinase XerD
LALQPVHIDSKRNIVLLKNAKETKMGYSCLKILEMLREYYLSFRPTTICFEGVIPNEPYSEKRSLPVLKQTLKKLI